MTHITPLPPCFLSSNPGKIQEVQSILGKIRHASLHGVQEIQSLNPREVLQAKLRRAAEEGIKGDIFVDDTSLIFPKLGKGLLPGPYIKDFLQNFSLEELHDLAQSGKNASEAAALCTLGYLRENGEILFAEGRREGKIVLPRGQNGFGWDFIFQPKGFTQTYAEMSQEEKNEISARRLALNALRVQL